MDDPQQLLVVIGAGVAGALLGVLIVVILDLPAGYASFGAIPAAMVAARLVRRS